MEDDLKVVEAGRLPEGSQQHGAWSDLVDIHNMAKESLEVVIQTTIWIIWQHRNRVCFDSRKLKAFEERIKLRKGGQDESQENLLFAHSEHSGKGKRF
nr:zinc finger, CCHC-type [Tanacetum cinerariifolium]